MVLSANMLGKQLLGQEVELKLPPVMVKVKTPSYPTQLACDFSSVVNRSVRGSQSGMTAKAEDENNRLIGFVVTG